MPRDTKKNDQPLVTLSIVSHGDANKINLLLDSLKKYEYAGQLEIIITDNLGNNIPEMNGSEWQSLSIIRNKKQRGYASNHNQAFQGAAGKYFCVLNPDVQFEQEIFLPLIARLEDRQADIVAPLIVDSNAVLQDSFRDFPTPFEIVRRRLPAYRFTHPPVDEAGLVSPDWIAGTFMLMRNETYRSINGFDQKYRLYFEDVDFCARARMAGLKLLVDTNVRIQHDAQRASRKKLVYMLWHVQSAIRFFTSPVYRKAFRRP